MATWRPSGFFYQHEFQLGPTRHTGGYMCEVSELTSVVSEAMRAQHLS